MRSSAAEAGLHLVGNAETAMRADDVIDDLKILGRRRDRPAHTLDRFGDETRNLTGRLVANEFFNVARTLHVAARILEAVWASVAVTGCRMLHAHCRVCLEFPVTV